jgi:fluoride exporter
MLKILIIGIGGGIGAVLRYGVSGLGIRFSNNVFPAGTLLVNATGSLLIGFIWALVDRFAITPNMRLFIFIGVLGGYTTFSTFSLETFLLLRDGEYRIALVNMAVSIVLTVGAVFAGYIAAKALMNVFK